MPGNGGPIRFGVFEVDLHSGELRKQGLRIKLRDQPFQILLLLLEHPGEVVSRDDLQKQLWPGDTFVGFDRGLNKAVNHLRDALGDRRKARASSKRYRSAAIGSSRQSMAATPTASQPRDTARGCRTAGSLGARPAA